MNRVDPTRRRRLFLLPDGTTSAEALAASAADSVDSVSDSTELIPHGASSDDRPRAADRTEIATMGVLVVSDESSLSAEILDLLRAEGTSREFHRVCRWDEARAEVARLPPDAVLCVLSPDVERGTRWLHELLPALPEGRVLAVGPTLDPHLIQRVLREGVTQYLDERQLATELADGLVHLRRWSAQRQRTGRLVVVLGATGGCGCSTVAVNLATCLAGTYGACTLLDLAFATGDLASLLNVQPQRSVADLCRNLDRVDAVQFDRYFTQHAANVLLLAASTDQSDGDAMTPDALRNLVQRVRGRFPLTVVDGELWTQADPAPLLAQAESVVVVLRADFAALRHAARLLSVLDACRFDPSRVQLVCNRYGEPGQLALSELQSALGRPILWTVPDDPAHVNRSANKGRPVVLDTPRSSSAKALQRLAKGLG
jgi:pilus assembly protein CpaE